MNIKEDQNFHNSRKVFANMIDFIIKKLKAIKQIKYLYL